MIGVPAFVLRDLDPEAGAPYRPHHEIGGEQREERDLRSCIEACEDCDHGARRATRSSARSTSPGSGAAPLRPGAPRTISIGPEPIAPVNPGSLPMKMATSGTPSAAAT